jgi:phage replication O-like protein O
MKKPNYTQISNDFIKEMSNYSGEVVKVFLAISRKTIGWHKDCDRISYSQLRDMTGLSINNIRKSLKVLIQENWIVQIDTKFGYKYDLNIEDREVIAIAPDAIACGAIAPDDIAISRGDTTKETNTKKKEKEKRGEAALPLISFRSLSPEGEKNEKEKSLKLIKSTSGTQDQPVGTEFSNLCFNLFGEDSHRLVYFLANMQYCQPAQLVRFVYVLKDTYTKDVIYAVMDSIEHRMERGEIPYYTPRYIIQALTVTAESDAQNDKDMEDSDMQRIFSNFKQFCLDYFADATIATEVYNFYTKTLNTKASRKEDKFDTNDASITKRRIANIQGLVDTYGKERFLKTVREFEERQKLGTLKSCTMIYFTNYIRKVATSKPRQSTLLTPPPAPQSNKEIPIRLERIGNEPFEWELYNWTYKCSCGEPVDPWNVNCSKCKVILDWEEAKQELSQALKELKLTAEGGS